MAESDIKSGVKTSSAMCPDTLLRLKVIMVAVTKLLKIAINTKCYYTNYFF